MKNSDFSDISTLVHLEVNRQDNKWGEDQVHSVTEWMTILMEEVGEAAQAVLKQERNAYISEAIQVAAVIFQMLQADFKGNYPDKEDS